MKNTIYTHDQAMIIIEMFEDVLSEYNIKVPSPEDDERGEGNDVGLYGSTYSELLDDVESYLISLLGAHKPDTKVVSYEFSGNI